MPHYQCSICNALNATCVPSSDAWMQSDGLGMTCPGRYCSITVLQQGRSGASPAGPTAHMHSVIALLVHTGHARYNHRDIIR